jgi:MoaA/NifB/PqqE/SkfB family radical SAM enzyme
MDPILLETILRESHKLGTFRVVLGGNGDPALHPHLDCMIELMMQLGMEPYVLTNGLAVDEKRAKAWSTKRAHFRFSIHAGDIETWLRVHPNGTLEQFERLSRVIKTLVSAPTCSVSIVNVIHKMNFRRVRKMIEYARKMGVREVLFRPVRAEGKLAQVILDADEEIQLRRELKHCLRLAESHGVRTNLGDYLQNNLYIHSGVLKTADIYRKIPCYLGWTHAEFDIDGTMTPCLHSKIVMGRAGEHRIRDMWLSSRYSKFRHQARSMPQWGKPVKGCLCNSCCMVKFNINIFNLLHLKSFKYGDS